MAVIGEMRQLTIGGKTYTLPTYSLPIASSSTLGGIKVGSGLSIDPSTGTLTATGTSITIDTAMSDSSTNAVQNKVIKAYVDGAIPTKVSDLQNDAGYTTNTGTVTSVRVQATSPVQSSTSTAQSATLNTTISLADAYGDTKNPYGSKTKNYVLAAPSNAAGAPTFRALVAADIPDLSSIYLTSYTETDPTVPAWAKASSKPTYTASEVGALPSTTVIPTKVSELTNDSGYITSYTDEKLKWTASTSSNTYYPLQSTSTATTSTANTLNSISFYQYYNTAGGYRRLILGNTTAYTSSGGAYGTIRLYGTGATYYGDLNPGTIGANSLTANRTWTLPNATGTIALTSQIPTVPTNISAFTNDAGYITSADVPEGASAYTGTISAVGTSASSGTNNGFARGDHVHNLTKTTVDSVLGTGSGTVQFYREDGTWATPAYTTNTDAKLQIAAVTSGTTYYPIVGANSTAAATRQYDATGIAYTGTNGTANGTNGNALLTLGNSTASTTANWKKGTVRLYGTTAYYTDLVSGAPSANRTITFPNATGTVALTSQIPTVPTNVSAFTNDAGYLTSYTETDPTVPSWAKASSKPTYTASEVGALASNTTYVSTITTTAGTHSAISSKSGAVSFNVPTKTSHLTNDSGYLTGITSSQVTTALGYTPYNSTNPNGYTSNTGTVTKVTAGTGLSIGTTAGGNFTTSGTINHTNSVTAQTTQAVYPIKIDAQGHISAYGSAVTIVNTRGTATSGGTTLSVVNTGDMYNWNQKTTVQIVRW